jgi:hypothetical protein
VSETGLDAVAGSKAVGICKGRFPKTFRAKRA